MKSVIGRVALAISIPVVVFAVFALLMMDLTGRSQFPQTDDPASMPLNSRIAGYNSTDVAEYWHWLGTDGRAAERRFLQADLAFPIVYGAGLLAGLFLSSKENSQQIKKVWLVLPVGITVLADWAENLIQLNQFARYTKNIPLQTTWIQIASFATSIKLFFFVGSAVLILVLCGRLLRNHNQKEK